jgi:hypothetical protein
MDTPRRWIEFFAPRSAIGITVMTLSIIFLMLGFFIQDIRLVPVEDDGADLAAEELDAGTSVRLGPGETYSTGPARRAVERSAVAMNNRPVTSPRTRTAPVTSDPARSVPVEPSERYSSNPAPQPRVGPGYVALLNRTCDCKWDGGDKGHREGAQFKVGQTLHLAAGLAEIVFGCGATAIVEGPAVLELQSNKTSSLRTGKLTAKVPDDVEGFAVNTPTVQLVSLCKLEPKGVAKLTATADCQWAEGNAVTKEGACLLPGQSVRLAGGLAEITFASGAKGILQGPANLQIESSKTATLHNGRITADVPDDLAGFKIRTSAAEILSLPAEPKEPVQKQVQKAKPAAAKL